MPLQTIGPISLSNVGSEFQNSAPYSMSEFYGAAAGIPASGAIGLSNFYGKSASKVETIIIPASETGSYFAGDSKNTGAQWFENVGSIPHVQNATYPLVYQPIYTKYSSFAAELGYSSIFIRLVPAYTSASNYSWHSWAMVHLTHLSPNSAVDPKQIRDLDLIIGQTRPYDCAGSDMIKSIKATKLGVTATFNYCGNTTQLAGTTTGSVVDPLFMPVPIVYPDSFYLNPPRGYTANVGDFPLQWDTGPQQYSVEIEWV